MRYALTLELDSYIGQPYWPEMARLVDIGKESGMNRARTAANRRSALEQYLQQHEMTLKQYEELERLATRPFHLEAVGPTNGASMPAQPHIVVPKIQVDGMLVAATDMVRAASKPCPPDQVRTMLRATPWTTDRTVADGMWERYAVVSSGTGAKLSNQRGLRRNEYIGRNPIEGTGTPANAIGAIELDPDMVKPDVVEKLLRWAGQNVGIGASRKMGFGRYRLLNFDLVG